ncbi:hypothetical protein MEA186_03114 [Mesorhizobium amorphae CCNWGS0123]|uniref:Uncharacterized protein n=1 Tax=Mesorhizobium amorphae CCNWGS0123 TaxID=1082933 RepID=G6Y3X0_9HYPH|nr:hypothetical protein MEA186_03114 [Mesorhizobium amorphae CCNWGS0123]
MTINWLRKDRFGASASEMPRIGKSSRTLGWFSST